MHTLPCSAEEAPKCMGRTSFYSPSGLPRGHPPSKQRKCLPGAGKQPEVTREFYSQQFLLVTQ